MKTFLRNNGLSIVVFALFLLFLVGQAITGFMVNNDELMLHGAAALSFGPYLISGHFVEAVFENWESEFLQMGAYVLLTVYLFQKGSAESKAIGKFEQVDAEPKSKKNSPWPVKKGGIMLALYKNSLVIALFTLCVLSFLLHAAGGSNEACSEDIRHGEQCDTMIEYMGTSQFWFESFQNWQSEFLAVFALVMLSIWLRQQGSPESKPVDAPHTKTGSE